MSRPVRSRRPARVLGVACSMLIVLVPVRAGAGFDAGGWFPPAASDGVEVCETGSGLSCPTQGMIWSGGFSFLGVPLGCELPEEARPRGTFSVVPGTTPVVGEGRLRTYSVEVEDGLAVDGDCFAAAVESVLEDPRSWTANGRFSFARVDHRSANIRILLASPRTVDRICYPLDTGGRLSCRSGNRAVLNVWRWRNGANAYGADLVNYRRYLVNHEVGHILGWNHRGCPGAGRLAPVMMQQTKGIGSCEPNPWPYPGA